MLVHNWGGTSVWVGGEMPLRTPSAPPIIPGLTYIRPLGSGGFADVYLYHQDMPRRDVAVKVLPRDVDDADLLRMFNAEADVLAHLSAHPSIVTVYQASISADGSPYIVMEYCPGSLAQRYRVERIPVTEVLDIGVRMANAVESAHRAGLIHRDIKPSNILVTRFGVPVLADFGIASALSLAHADDVLAMSVPWSAPEVVSERTGGTIASEVWSLAATVYSLIAGRSPFERRERGQNSRDHLQRRIERATYVPLTRADVPDALQSVLARAMSRDPRLRFGSALEFGEALRAIQVEAGETPTAVEVPVDEWEPGSEVDFADASMRAGTRVRVGYESARKMRQRGSARDAVRDEDTEISHPAPERRRSLPWLLMGVGTLVIAALVVAIVAVWTG